MNTNHKVLAITLEDIANVPFFMLAQEKREQDKKIISNIMEGLRARLSKRMLENTAIFKKTTEITTLLKSETFNEYKITDSLKDLIILRKSNDSSQSDDLIPLLNKICARSKIFWISEEAISTNKYSQKQIDEKTAEVLGKSLQLYALDYFLMAHETLKTADFSLQKKILLEGYGKLPPLVSDALEDDTLIMVVYNLTDKKLRYQMISDYYEYKIPFLRLDPNAVSENDIIEIKKSLLKYCQSLINISIKHNINKFENGLYSHYIGMNFTDILKQLS